MAATTSINSCTSSFFSLRTGSVEPCRVRSTPNHPGCGKVDGVATWFINGVAAAFFASLERCSCIRIATTEDDDCDDDANDLALIFNDGNFRGGDDGSRSSRRRKGKGKKGGSGGAYGED